MNKIAIHIKYFGKKRDYKQYRLTLLNKNGIVIDAVFINIDRLQEYFPGITGEFVVDIAEYLQQSFVRFKKSAFFIYDSIEEAQNFINFIKNKNNGGLKKWV